MRCSKLIRGVFLLQILLVGLSFRGLQQRTYISHCRIQMSTSPLVTIGTRGSPLALAQAYETKRLLGVHFPELATDGAVEIKKIMTKVGTSNGGKRLHSCTVVTETVMVQSNPSCTHHTHEHAQTYIHTIGRQHSEPSAVRDWRQGAIHQGAGCGIARPLGECEIVVWLCVI